MPRHLESRIYPIYKLAAAVAAMKAEGISIERALRGTGLSADDLNSSASRMSLSQLLAAYRNALECSHDPYFAVRLGQSVRVTTYGIYGFALLSSPTQRAAIELVLKYHRLVSATADLSFREESQSKVGIWTITPLTIKSTDSELYRFIVEVYLGTILALSRDICETPERIRKEIRVTYPRSPQMRIYEKIFRCPVLFGQGNNELRINTTWLDEPTRRCNQLTFMAAQKLCAETLDLMDLSDGIAGELRQILMESIGRFPTVETICRRFGMSPRTFRRKLNAEGTSYANLVNDTRANLAKKYLSETMMTVDEIANRIGYSDTSNFRYAFYRKMGITPAEYRRRKDGTVIALD